MSAAGTCTRCSWSRATTRWGRPRTGSPPAPDAPGRSPSRGPARPRSRQSNVLSDRLRVLVEEGVLDRVPYQERPVRHEYRLTPKGADLYPVLVALMNWGDRYAVDVPPVRLVHRGCGHPAEPRLTCAHCGEPVAWRDMTAEVEPDAW
ncbi:winged helix-turn-helix transcriptional regulator [Pseudonocardia alni]|uniref:winged helix-turn-helix transcriptional regulator n=1 Tax=Pseudonocardia alni TaxID=33907 RepID=UPI00280B37E6|nr:winged helix-turn-helix transcriptional regulator [Pseudonocardia alni]